MRYRRELGQEIDPWVASGAVEHLHAAGLRASARIDVTAAANLLERAFALTNALFTARWLVVTALFDDRRRASVPAVLRGLLDGLTGRVARRHLPPGAEYGPAEAGARPADAR